METTTKLIAAPETGFSIKHYTQKTDSQGNAIARESPYYAIIARDGAGHTLNIQVDEKTADAALEAHLAARLLAIGSESSAAYQTLKGRLTANAEGIDEAVKSYLKDVAKQHGVRAQRAVNTQLPAP